MVWRWLFRVVSRRLLLIHLSIRRLILFSHSCPSGNALGNIYIPCQAATSTPPSGARTGRTARSSGSGFQNEANNTPSAHHVYTFFGDAVTPTPSYTFPPSKSKRKHESMAHGMSTGTATFALGSASASGSGTSTRAQTPAPEYRRLDVDVDVDVIDVAARTPDILPGSINFDLNMDYVRVNNDNGGNNVVPTEGGPSSLRVFPGDSSGVVYDADGMPSLGRRRARLGGVGFGSGSGDGMGNGNTYGEAIPDRNGGNVNRDPNGERITSAGDGGVVGGIVIDDLDVGDEPGSPDKYSAEVLMSPAR